jgi:predicted GTPase
VDTAGWMQRRKVQEGPAALSAMHARKGVMMSHVVALILDGEEVFPFVLIHSSCQF